MSHGSNASMDENVDDKEITIDKDIYIQNKESEDINNMDEEQQLIAPFQCHINTIKGHKTRYMKSQPDWFEYNCVSEIEKVAFADFFDGSDEKKTPQSYQSTRNIVYDLYHNDPKYNLALTTCRRYVPLETCALMRIYSFLEQWGLINYMCNNINELLDNNNNNNNDDISNIVSNNNNNYAEKLISTPDKLLQSFCSYKENMPIISNCNITQDVSNLPIKKSNLKNATATQMTNFLDNILTISDKNEQSTTTPWSNDEICKLLDGVKLYNDDWESIAKYINTDKNVNECVIKYLSLADCNVYNEIDDTNVNEKIIENVETNDDYKFLDDPNHPLIHLIAALASSVHPKILKAACKAANDTLDTLLLSENDETMITTKKTTLANENVVKRKFVTDPTIVKSVCGAVAAVTVKARERQLQHVNTIELLVRELVGKQLEKIEIKLKQLNEMENAFNIERNKLKLQQQLHLSERVKFQADLKSFNHDVEMFKKIVSSSVNKNEHNIIQKMSNEITIEQPFESNTTTNSTTTTNLSLDTNSDKMVYRSPMDRMTNSIITNDINMSNMTTSTHQSCNQPSPHMGNDINEKSNIMFPCTNTNYENNNYGQMNQFGYSNESKTPQTLLPNNTSMMDNDLINNSSIPSANLLLAQNQMNNNYMISNAKINNNIGDNQQFVMSSHIPQNQINPSYYNNYNSRPNSVRIPINNNITNHSSSQMCATTNVSPGINRETIKQQPNDPISFDVRSQSATIPHQIKPVQFQQILRNIGQPRIGAISQGQGSTLTPSQEQYILQQQLNMIMNPCGNNNNTNMNSIPMNTNSNFGNNSLPPPTNQIPVGFSPKNTLAHIPNIQSIHGNNNNNNNVPNIGMPQIPQQQHQLQQQQQQLQQQLQQQQHQLQHQLQQQQLSNNEYLQSSFNPNLMMGSDISNQFQQRFMQSTNIITNNNGGGSSPSQKNFQPPNISSLGKTNIPNTTTTNPNSNLINTFNHQQFQ